MSDQYFTPPSIAAQLVSAFRRKNESCIADFAAGDGGLLVAALAKWPDAEIVATDINAASVRRLRSLHSSWSVSKCNFLDEASRARSAALREAMGKVSLVVLNPPFSCRGGQRHLVNVRDAGEVQSSRAMAFVLTAAEYLSSEGRIAAILPRSCLHSKKDAAAWSLLRKSFNVKELKSYGTRTFDGCSAKTAIVTLTGKMAPSKGTYRVRRTNRRRLSVISVRIVRGAIPVHRAMNGLAGPNWPVVHTTNLRDSRVKDIHMWLRDSHRHAAGPAVLLPRVGKPDFGKFVIYRGRQKLVLSDCVYALLCDSTADAECLHNRLGNAWEGLVEKSYDGTCAPYLTVDALIEVLTSLGCVVNDVQAAGFGAKR